jgi:hypothetical protein
VPVFVPSTAGPTPVGRFREVVPAGATLSLGVPFLTAAFGPQAAIAVEAAFGADITASPSSWTWYDITGDVRQANGGGISISPMGRADESSTAQPAGCAFELANDSGNYTAYNRVGRWWPYVRRNTPIRVRINLTGLAADWMIRFQGEATSWTPSWDVSAALPVVAVTATGITRRLGQGKSPERSALARTIAGQSVAGVIPLLYHPLEDASGATQAAEYFGGVPLAPTGTVSWAADSKTTGSAPLPTWAAGSRVQAYVPAYTSSGAWTMAAVISVPATPAAKTTLVEVATAGAAAVKWRITLTNALLLNLEAYNSAGTEILGAPGVTFDASNLNAPLQVNIKAAQSGADTSWSLVAFPLSGVPTSYSTLGTATGLTTPAVTGWTFAPDANLAGATFGHAAVFNSATTGPIQTGFQGWPDERATVRLARLCAEHGVPLTIIGGSSTTTMGPQTVATFMSLLRECETADQGVLLDGLGPGLTYIIRDARYNATATLTLDVAAGQVDDPFEPVDDDQRDRNVAKVDRTGGSSYTSTVTGGAKGTAAIGTYDTSLTVNVDSDGVLPFYASWLTHLGTVEGFRYPSLNLDLYATPAIAQGWLGTSVCSRIDVLNVASVAPQHPIGTVRLLLEGWSEQLSPFVWTVQANMSQYDGWRVGVLAADVGDTNPLLGHLDTDGSVTLGTTAAGASSITVAVNTGPLWTTAGDDFPFDITVNGQRVSVASISGSSSPQTFNVDPAGSQILYQIPAGEAVTVADGILPAL